MCSPSICKQVSSVRFADVEHHSHDLVFSVRLLNGFGQAMVYDEEVRNRDKKEVEKFTQA